MKAFFYATAMLIGAIVGVGIFGIPYVSARAGFWVGEAYIVGLLLLVLVLHLCYGEVVERTKSSHRIVGYAGVYLGKRMKYATSLIALASGYVALLLYIIAAGKFFSLLALHGITFFWGSILFWFFGALALGRGMRPIASVEFFMTGFLLLVLSILTARGMFLVHVSNFTPPNPSESFLPYGVILFALSGTFAIPEMRLILSNGKRYAAAIIAGTIVPAILYLLFNIAVVGISGTHTSIQAIEGIIPAVGEGMGWLGALAGLLAVATSYLAFSLNLKHMLMFDWGVHPAKATFFIAAIPGVLFLMGLQQFITVMSVAGGIFGAAVGIIILLVYLRARQSGDRTPAFSLGISAALVYTVIAALALAGLYQIIYWVH